MTTIIPQTGLEESTPPATQSRMNAAAAEPDGSLEPTPEQLRYARFVEKGMRLGLGCLLVTFPLYIFGIMEPQTPLEKVHECWAFSAEEYCSQSGIEPGWGWVRLLGRGDFINFVGITILAGVTAVCYLAVIPLMLKRKDTVYVVLALLQVVVLGLAASGLLAVGGH